MANDSGNEAGDRDGAEGASGAERLSAPPDASREPRLPFPVVGIGASAGGLEAYSEFLQACPADAGMAYVLVQHLPPDRESLLAEILARHTAMPVREVRDGMPVEVNHVYVIRPGHTLTILEGRLRLSELLAARGHGRPVDDLFRSLAEEQQQRAVAVVFSGMGSNGTAGAEAVKAVGGLVIAQEPDSAKFPGMPRSLIDAHLPDYILAPAEVPDALVRYAGHPYVAAPAGADPAEAAARDEQALADVLAVLRTRTRHDFSGYRKPTIRRRVQRRMGIGQFATFGEYVRALRQTPAEVTALADDLLIHVTGFFRDPDAWAALREKVIDPLVVERTTGSDIRCWVAACATGEEAYTLAMLLVEAAEAAGKWFDLKVFATDMAERALGHARAGVFPNGIESEVTPERLVRFFDKDDAFYRVKKELRERVIFAPQNVLQDPPFSRLDIATCRNLLIYLEPDTQRRVLAALHFGLREGGCLMLGSSESAAPAEGDFEPIDKKHRLFRRVGPTRPGTLDLRVVAAAIREARAPLPPPARPVPTAVELVNHALLDAHTPAAVAVDSTGQVVHVHGETGRYLTLPPGMPTHDIFALANTQVRGAVRTALHRAADAHAPVTIPDGVIETPEGRRRIEIGAAPLGPRGTTPLYLITFREVPEPPPAAPTNGEPMSGDRLANELQRVRNELQGAMEEMQSSNEELKASHEEATSLNEELQSTNEELETSKEEMQSLNEELVTVNAQLTAKMGELEATANDLGSLLTSTDIAVLFLDPRFRIRRFTPAVKDLLDLIPSDVGRPLSDLRRKFTDPDLAADAQVVLDRLIPVEREVASESGRHYLRRVLPYRTQDNRIDGVVVAFVDVSERKAAERALAAEKVYAESIVMTLHEPLLVLNPDLTVKSVNPAFYTHFRVDPADTIGRRVYHLGNGQWDIPALRTLLEDVLPDSHVFNDYEVTHEFETLGRRVMLVNGRRLDSVQLILLGIRDITERARAEAAVAEELRNTTILQTLSARLVTEDDPQAIYEAILTAAIDITRADAGSVQMFDDGTAELVVLATRGFSRATQEYFCRVDAGSRTSCGMALRTGERAVMDFDPTSPDRGTRLHAEDGLLAAQSSPLVTRSGKPIGMVSTHWRQAGRRPTERELRFLDLLARQAADVIERQQAAHALRASEEKYRTLFASMDEGYLLAEVEFDAAGNPADILYLEANPAAVRLAGRDFTGRRMRDIDPGYEPHWFETYGRVARTGEPVRDTQYAGPHGRWFEFYAFKVGEPESRRVAAVFQDVTDRKRDEERRAYLLTLSDALRPLSDPAAIQAEACRVLGEHLGADRAYYVEINEAAGVATIAHDYLRGDSPSLVGRHRVADYGWTIDPLRAGETLVVTDATADPRIPDADRPAMAAVRIAAQVHAPLVKGGVLAGVLCASEPAPRAWTAAEVELVRETAERTWAAVERARAERDLAAELDAMTRLRDLSDRLLAAPDLPAALADVLATAVALHGADRGTCQLYDAASDGLVYAAYQGFDDGALARIPPVCRDFHSTCAAALRTGAPVIAADLAADPRFAEHAATAAGLGYRAAYSFPLTTRRGEFLGVLTVHFAEPHEPTDRELRWAALYTPMAAHLIERQRAEVGLRVSEERLRMALGAARMGIWTLDTATGTQTRDASLNRLLGLEPVETSQPFDEFLGRVHPADRDRVRAAFDESVRDGRPLNVEFRVVRPDGEVRWLRDQGDVFGDGVAGRRVMAGACVDVTERRAAEEAVRAGEERLKQIMDSATDYAILTQDDARVVTSWSPGAAATFGYAADEIVGRPADELFTPEDRAAGEPAREAEAARRDGRAADERWHLRKDGSRFYASGVLSPLAAGGFVKVARDLTERKRIEDELRAARALLEQRVAERTAELSGAIDALEAEMERRRGLAQQLTTAQETERKRVSRDLHDTVGQTHAALAMALRAAAAAVPARGEAADKLAYAAGLAEAMGKELHEAAVRLRPTALDDIGLGPAVAELVTTWAARAGVAADYDITGLNEARLPAAVETALYRVVQEALTNVVRHAAARTVSVTVGRAEGEARAVVEDDGVGFDPEAGTARLGLAGMRERVELLAGTLEIESTPGAGTTVVARVPVPGPPG